MSRKEYCIGCKLSNNKLKTYVVYENDYINCILDHQPFNTGHTLILPKIHYREVEELDEKTYDEIMKASIFISKAIKEVYYPDGITICQNGGIFSELEHYHMHIVPRYIGQSFADFYKDDGAFEEIEEVYFNETITKLKLAISKILQNQN